MELKDLIYVYGPAFAEIYEHDKERISKILGIEQTSVSGARKYMQRLANEVNLGKTNFFGENKNLVAILETNEDGPLRIMRQTEVNREMNVLSLTVPRWQFTYIFMYRTENNGGQQNGK